MSLFPQSRLTDSHQLNTTHGPIKLEIFCEAVPKASENFLALCASGRYDGSAVHRILKDFIMQAGAPAGDSKAKVRRKKALEAAFWQGFATTA
jgi:cyclophilin family peptidyl-prolyl cis-trans isomerase